MSPKFIFMCKQREEASKGVSLTQGCGILSSESLIRSFKTINFFCKQVYIFKGVIGNLEKVYINQLVTEVIVEQLSPWLCPGLLNI